MSNIKLAEKDSLIERPYLEKLVLLQRDENLKMAVERDKAWQEQIAKKKAYKAARDTRIVALYLNEKFPQAYAKMGGEGLKEKEFPSILKKARHCFQMRLGLSITWLLGSLGALYVVLMGTLSMFIAVPLGLISFLSLFISCLSLIDLSRILICGKDLLNDPDRSPKPIVFEGMYPLEKKYESNQLD